MSALSSELLELLACPKCKGGLIYSGEKNTLSCSACRRIFPIHDEIPIMLLESSEQILEKEIIGKEQQRA